jgi:hypothetical protein
MQWIKTQGMCPDQRLMMSISSFQFQILIPLFMPCTNLETESMMNILLFSLELLQVFLSCHASLIKLERRKSLLIFELKMEQGQFSNRALKDHRGQGNHHMKRSIPYFKEQLVPDFM